MLRVRIQRLPWQLTCLLFAAVATAAISPSNTSTAGTQFQGTLPLKHAQGDTAQITQLVPLTREAAQRTIEGNLYNTNFSDVAQIGNGNIAYISCNPNDYSGFLDSQRLFQTAYGAANLSGVILYSTETDYCAYTQDNSQDMMQNFPILSMTNKQDSTTLRDAIVPLPPPVDYSVQVQGRGDSGSGSNNGSQQTQQNPLGPSPSTAVAMIILYSITGIITALFLVIIITGAIRAHRHPERYGPRNVLGRPRQSRARGLGRAILDTIPIVKFGEKEPAKPTDVELGSTSEARETHSIENNLPANREATSGTEATEAVPTADANTNDSPQHTTGPPVVEDEEGIAPAQAHAVGAAMGADRTSHDENLGCSICTEDFEMGQDLRVLPCDHKFHPECVDPWLLNVSGTCPLCRVDLRPVTSHDSATSQDPDGLAPPLNPEPENTTGHRRRTAFRDILSLRHRPNATPEERIYALRRLREQRRNHSGEAAGSSENASAEDVVTARDRRSRRISVRLSDVFGGRSRRDRTDETSLQREEPSGSDTQQQPPDRPHVPDAGARSNDR